MVIDDPLLPAAAYLTGPDAIDVVRPAVEGAGGTLGPTRCVGLQYRPGASLVAQFAAEVSWRGAAPVRETLVAAATAHGPPEGTVPVVAEHAGGQLAVGVWRWPFDPQLPALERVTRRSSLTELLQAAGLDGDDVEISVVAYRPTERAVVRVRTPSRTWYVKVVAPDRAAPLAETHRRLAGAGLPVAPVAAADAALGWLALAELRGPTLREQIKSGAETWIATEGFRALVERIASIDPGPMPPVRSRVLDAPAHAAMLASVLPDQRRRLAELGARMAEVRDRADRPRVLVHGDLHEGQLITAGDRIVGLLDIDDAGPGDPLDDVAVMVGHLRYRAMATRSGGDRIDRFADELVDAFSSTHDRADIERVVASVLVGIATAPFRLQHAGWPRTVLGTVGLAEAALARAR